MEDTISTETVSVAKTLPGIATLGKSSTTDCLFTSLASVSSITDGSYDFNLQSNCFFRLLLFSCIGKCGQPEADCQSLKHNHN